MRRFKYWIFDTENTPQRFPVQRLLKTVSEIFQYDFKMIRLVRCKGFGLEINNLASVLDSREFIDMPIDKFYELAEGEKEWFYEFSSILKNDSLEICLGLHDSTALYIESKIEIGESLKKYFSKVSD